MEALRQSWTDDRLDDLTADMNRRFDDVGKRFEQVDKRFEQVDKRFEQVDKRFDRVEGQLEALRAEFKEDHVELRKSSEELRAEMCAQNDERARESRGVYRTLFMFMGGFCSALIGLVGLLIVQL